MISKETLLLAAEEFLTDVRCTPDTLTGQTLNEALMEWEVEDECWDDYSDEDVATALLLIAEAQE